MPAKDKPWVMRTYAGHSTAEASNALYRTNLAKGQTGLSVAFDLPTQTGYDSDHVLAKGEVGKVGVPVAHLGDMRALFDQIPLDQMNTSMTINATAMWLLALYQAVAEEHGHDVVVPSLPGCAFSGRPDAPIGPRRTASSNASHSRSPEPPTGPMARRMSVAPGRQPALGA